MLRASALAFGLALVAAGGSSAEIVARGVQDGMLALGANGTPYVAYVHGTKVVLTARTGKDRWRATNIGSAAAGSQVKAFTVGSRGPVALVQTADGRKIFLVRRVQVGWQTIRIAGSLAAGVRLGWPGLALDKKGLPVVAYTRWESANFKSRLLLVRVDARGKLTSKRITYEGFPQSYVPPPAKPVIVGGRIDVIESYGYHGVVGTIEWYPNKRTWTGLFIDAGVGDFPLGPVLALHGRTGRVYAAWTESMLGIGEAPVTLAERGKLATAEFVLDRALATGLALPASGPEVAANEWVDAGELDLAGDAQVWAGTVVRAKEGIELDGWIAGFAASSRGGRDLLLGGPAGLRWFRAARELSTRVSLDANGDEGASVQLTGTVAGVSSGRVTIYRERPGSARQAVGKPALSGGAFSFVDNPTVRPLLYRAVYTDPATGIPYASLLRVPVG
jgi:hypothetical protein